MISSPYLTGLFRLQYCHIKDSYFVEQLKSKVQAVVFTAKEYQDTDGLTLAGCFEKCNKNFCQRIKGSGSEE